MDTTQMPPRHGSLSKKANLEEATALFQGTGVSITVEGKRHLGAAIGTHSFVEKYVQRKVSGWVRDVERLSSIAITQPHAANAAFTQGLTSKWIYLARTIADIEDLFQTLEDAIRQRFLPSLTGQVAFGVNAIWGPPRFGDPGPISLGLGDPCQRDVKVGPKTLAIRGLLGSPKP